MSKLIIQFPIRVFNLAVNSVTDRISDKEYSARSASEKLDLHKQDLLNEVNAILRNSFGIEAVTRIHPIQSEKKLIIYLDDFEVTSDIVDKVMTEVIDAVAFHRGILVAPENVKVLMTNSVIVKENK